MVQLLITMCLVTKTALWLTVSSFEIPWLVICMIKLHAIWAANRPGYYLISACLLLMVVVSQNSIQNCAMSWHNWKCALSSVARSWHNLKHAYNTPKFTIAQSIFKSQTAQISKQKWKTAKPIYTLKPFIWVSHKSRIKTQTIHETSGWGLRFLNT